MAREVLAPVDDDAPDKPRRPILSFFKELPVLVGLALVIALVIKALLVQAFYIPSGSMEPTLDVGDRVLVNKLTYRFRDPQRGDVVVFKDPYGDPCVEGAAATTAACNKSVGTKVKDWFVELFGLPTNETKDYIKRIVALPGETVQMRDGEVYICDEPNCVPLDSSGNVKDGRRIEFEIDTNDEGEVVKGPDLDTYDLPPTTIEADSYYVMGDNRGNSSDSRAFGSVIRDKIVGKAFVLVWPPTRFGGL